MISKRRVIVTNDDGIASPGLLALAQALSHDLQVIVAAPAVDLSGAGTGIGRLDPDVGVELTRVDLDGISEAYSIDGPPGLAVTAAALGAFGPVPDLVVSGINAGINTGHSIIHSGTVGAALTANTFGIKGLAVSVAESDPWMWTTAATLARCAAGWLLDRTDGLRVLNVNVPGVPPDEVAGVRWADLDDFGSIRVASADVELRRLQFVVGARTDRSDPASDTTLCANRYVTVTPLRGVEPAPFPDVDARNIIEWPITDPP